MTNRRRHLVPLAIASLLLAPAVLPVTGPAAEARVQSQTERTFMRVVRPVDVKSGPQDYYYSFLKLAEGDIVEVTDRTTGTFATILTRGPRFLSGFALVRVRDDETFTVSGPERTITGGRTVRSGVGDKRLQVLYPNLDEENLLDRSWRMIRRIDPGTTVDVIGSPIIGEGVTLYRMPLPADALGYVASDALVPASPAEAKDFVAWETDPAAWLARRRAEAEAQARVMEQQRLAAAAAVTAETPAAEITPATPVEPVAVPERTIPSPDTTAAGDAVTVAVTETGATADTDATPAEGEGGTNADTAEPTGSDALSALPPLERLEALEASMKTLQAEDARRVEVLPLAALYREFAEAVATEDPEAAEFARTRVRQLELWARLQAQRERIEALRGDVATTDTRLAEAAGTIQQQLGFNAVGRLAGSRIFDGRRLPRLMRLESLETGRTIAYVRASGELELDTRVGEVVGLFGTRTYDPGLQLDIIDAVRVQSVRLEVTEPAPGS
jgi:hypothetical protein